LHIVLRENPDNAVTRRLRLLAGYAQLFTDQPIQQRRFSGVWFPDDGDEAGFGNGYKPTARCALRAAC